MNFFICLSLLFSFISFAQEHPTNINKAETVVPGIDLSKTIGGATGMVNTFYIGGDNSTKDPKADCEQKRKKVILSLKLLKKLIVTNNIKWLGHL